MPVMENVIERVLLAQGSWNIKHLSSQKLWNGPFLYSGEGSALFGRPPF